jgi:predicted DNA-binding protein
MATSFRLDDELESLLQYTIERTGRKRSQLIREALSKYCAEIVEDIKKGPYERLVASNFEPVGFIDQSNLASNTRERRKRLRERSARDNR